MNRISMNVIIYVFILNINRMRGFWFVSLNRVDSTRKFESGKPRWFIMSSKS